MPIRVIRGSSLQTQTPGAVTDLLEFRVRHIGECEQEVGGGFFVFDRDVSIPLEPAVGAADDRRGRIVPVMGVAVAHTAAEVNQGTIEKRGIAVGGFFEFADELCKFDHVVRRQLGVLLDSFRLVAMM